MDETYVGGKYHNYYMYSCLVKQIEKIIPRWTSSQKQMSHKQLCKIRNTNAHNV